jgi:hypothetical protein
MKLARTPRQVVYAMLYVSLLYCNAMGLRYFYRHEIRDILCVHIQHFNEFHKLMVQMRRVQPGDVLGCGRRKKAGYFAAAWETPAIHGQLAVDCGYYHSEWAAISGHRHHCAVGIVNLFIILFGKSYSIRQMLKGRVGFPH